MSNSQIKLGRPSTDLLSGGTLFLDVDGTLVEFAQRPDAVVVGARVKELVHDLARLLGGRIALVSGRSVGDVDAMFGGGFFGRVSIGVAGSHGLEMRWPDGRLETHAPPVQLEHIGEEMEAFAQTHPGVVVERKPFSVALHFRTAPGAAHACRDLALDLEQRTGLRLQPGSMVFELRAGWADKGTAVRRFMEDSVMASARPLYVGDDQTDEDGFTAAADLGGAGVLVGAVRATAAKYNLPDVPATLSWLEACCREL